MLAPTTMAFLARSVFAVAGLVELPADPVPASVHVFSEPSPCPSSAGESGADNAQIYHLFSGATIKNNFQPDTPPVFDPLSEFETTDSQILQPLVLYKYRPWETQSSLARKLFSAASPQALLLLNIGLQLSLRPSFPQSRFLDGEDSTSFISQLCSPGPVPSPPGFPFLRFSSRNCRFVSIRRAIRFVSLKCRHHYKCKQASKQIIRGTSPGRFRFAGHISFGVRGCGGDGVEHLLEVASPESLLEE